MRSSDNFEMRIGAKRRYPQLNRPYIEVKKRLKFQVLPATLLFTILFDEMVASVAAKRLKRVFVNILNS